MKVFQKCKFFEKCNLVFVAFDADDVITTSGPVDGFYAEDGGYFDDEGNLIIQ